MSITIPLLLLLSAMLIIRALILKKTACNCVNWIFLQVYDCGSKGFLSDVELKDMLTALRLPIPVHTLLSSCGDGPTLQITYGENPFSLLHHTVLQYC